MGEDPAGGRRVPATLRLEDGSPAAAAVQETVLIPPEEQEALAGDRDGIGIREEKGADGRRFQRRQIIGAGSMGRVFAAYDEVLGREVAIKMMLGDSEDLRLEERFLAEARLTARLDHPSIVPVYDMGRASDAQPFYVMRKVSGRPLAAVLAGPDRPRFARLVAWLLQVARAVHFAHKRGVVHRDLKPDNIMIGDDGEVTIVDWGVAHFDGRAQLSLTGDPGDPIGGPGTRAGTAIGTPGYMSPEQARGETTALDGRSDLWSLGSILLEMHTGRRPAEGTQPLQLVRRVAGGETPALPDDLPSGMERILRRCLASDRDDRFADVGEFIEELEGWQEGRRRADEADRWVAEGDRLWARTIELRAEVEVAREDRNRRRSAISPWDPISRKRGWLDAARRLEAAEVAEIEALGRCIAAYERALAHSGDHSRARHGLARAYWHRYVAAEARHDIRDTAYYRSRVVAYGGGAYREKLAEGGLLSLRSDPPGAEVIAHRLAERDLVLMPGPGRALGRTPLSKVPLATGSYLLLLRSPGRPDTRYPVRVVRGSHWDARDPAGVERPVPLAQPGWENGNRAYVAEGPLLTGRPADPIERWIDGFSVARRYVTLREYIDFLDDLESRGRGLEAQRHLPREPYDVDNRREAVVRRRSDGRYELTGQVGGRPVQPDWPATLIDARAARAYCAWLSERTGQAARLATSLEIEKAVRGVDGRRYPWGERFDATLCAGRYATSESPSPRPLGTFPRDRSIYGVLDGAGACRTWCDPDAIGSDVPPGRLPVRGGGWLANERSAQCQREIVSRPDERRGTLGVRVAFSLKV